MYVLVCATINKNHFHCSLSPSHDLIDAQALLCIVSGWWQEAGACYTRNRIEDTGKLGLQPHTSGQNHVSSIHTPAGSALARRWLCRQSVTDMQEREAPYSDSAAATVILS